MKKNLLISNPKHYEWYNNFYQKNNFDFLPIREHMLEEKTYQMLIDKNYDEYDTVLYVTSHLHLIEQLSIFSFEINAFEESWKRFISGLSDKFRFILFDDYPEGTHDTVTRVDKFLNLSDRTFLISQRHGSLTHERAITDLVYINVISNFYTLHFNEMPKLDYSPPSKPINIFRTYLGVATGAKESKREMRLNDIKYILKDDLSDLKYKEKGNFKVTTTFDSFAMTWNLLEALNCKIQIMFENMGPSSKYDDYYNLTEKTTRCFYLPHPYILLVDSGAIEKLKLFGFRFSYSCDGLDDFRDLLTEVRSDIDGWIQKNRLDFHHNQDNLFNLVKSEDLPHYNFLKKIIN